MGPKTLGVVVPPIPKDYLHALGIITPGIPRLLIVNPKERLSFTFLPEEPMYRCGVLLPFGGIIIHLTGFVTSSTVLLLVMH